jgi:diguanylate cyclase (GGDEF)-like protein/PAS domain S-box-containing protein
MQRSGNDLERACAELAAYQAAFERHALVSLADPAGNIIRVNDLFCQVSGHTREELVGLNHRVLQSGRHSREFWSQLWRTITRGGVWRGEICNRAKDGHLFWTETTIVPIRDADDHIVEYMAIRTDVTARKQMEAALVSGRRAVQAASRSRSELLAQAGAAIRAPLTAMLGYAELLDQAAESGELSAGAARHVGKLRRAGPHVLAMFNDIIDLARIDAGKLVLMPDYVEPCAVMNEVLARFEGVARRRDVTLDVDCPGSLEPLRTDAGRLAQILSALLERSIDWSPGGTVRVTLRRLRRAGEHEGLEVEVADNGTGLSAVEVSRLFEPQDAAGMVPQGTESARLGLCLSQRLAGLLGGAINVHSDVGSGTTFTLRIRPLQEHPGATVMRPVLREVPEVATATEPSARRPAAAPPPEPVTDTARMEAEGSRQRLLVVDDSEDVHELVERHLRDFGVVIEHASSCQAALATALQRTPDLILVDYDMSVRGGVEALREMRQNEKLESVPFIFVTDSTDTAIEVQAFRNGAVDFLRKPFQPAVLRARVRAALQNRALRDLLEREALHDRLTGLPNRALIQGRIGDAVAMKRADPRRNYALLFLDFDRFKLLNDTLGHEAGDELLRQIAQRMRAVTRASDQVLPGTSLPITARLGGDEFVVLLEGLAATQDALQVAERLLQRLSEEFEIRGTRVVSTASIGIVLGDASYGSAVEVLRDADAAMYEAKAAGRGRCVVFDATMRSRVQDRVKLERDLRLALENEELFLEYQPIVSLRTGRMEGIEALLRWSHPQRGRVSPIEFVTLAEEAGLISEIGEWALRRACLDFLALRRVMGEHAPRTISVNVSRQQLTRDFPGRVDAIVQDAGMDATALRIEVTENGIMRDPEQAVHVLRGLKDLGIGIHVDDFGTGSSSLACLHQFPVDTLKIDRSFIANSGDTPGAPALVTAIVQMARTLGIGVVAEGIETPEQLLLLQSMDCEFGQGYLLGRPMPVERIVSYRRETPPALALPETRVPQGCAA